VDGNKRAALVAAYTFLAINDLDLDAPETEAVSMMLGLADGSIPEEDLASWIRSHLIPWVD
jgi:death-on-curing protein